MSFLAVYFIVKRVAVHPTNAMKKRSDESEVLLLEEVEDGGKRRDVHGPVPFDARPQVLYALIYSQSM